MKYTVTKITNKPNRFNWRKSPGGWKAIQKDNRKDQQKSYEIWMTNLPTAETQKEVDI